MVKADAVVIGAGAGGLCAAARLAHGGLYTLVVDDKDRLGGRASTEADRRLYGQYRRDRDRVRAACSRRPSTPSARRSISARRKPASSFFIDGKLIDVGRGGWSLLLGQLTKAGLAYPWRNSPTPASGNSARRAAIDRGLAEGLHQQRLGARDLPQPLRGDLRLQRRTNCRRARSSTYFTSKGAFKQRLRLLPAGHDRTSGTRSGQRDQAQWRYLARRRRR